MSTNTFSGIDDAEGSAIGLIDTATELVFRISPDTILAEAGNGDVRAAVTRLLAQQGMKATSLAIDDTVERLTGGLQPLPE